MPPSTLESVSILPTPNRFHTSYGLPGRFITALETSRLPSDVVESADWSVPSGLFGGSRFVEV